MHQPDGFSAGPVNDVEADPAVDPRYGADASPERASEPRGPAEGTDPGDRTYRVRRKHNLGGHDRPDQPLQSTSHPTIEDPVEFVHKIRKTLIRHRKVGLHTFKFRNALRAALRGVPSVIL